MYYVEVLCHGETTWSGNGMVFKDAEDAEKWAVGLFNRWYAVRKWRVMRKSDAAEGGMNEVVKEGP